MTDIYEEKLRAAAEALALKGRSDPDFEVHHSLIAQCLGIDEGSGEFDWAMCEALDTADAGGFKAERAEYGTDPVEFFMDVVSEQLESIL